MRKLLLTLSAVALLFAGNAARGPESGSKIPAFSAKDQKGTAQTFESVKGKNGAVLVFYRSADW